MGNPTTVYIGLGSNQGNRFAYLQKATNAIFERVGSISATAPVYETPAWGFEGHDFLNTCLAVETYCSAEKLLNKLLHIEQEFGRKRHHGGYANRTLDLDILFYANAKIESKTLVVPHPHLPKRRFVLQPLVDIAPQFKHPELGKTVSELLLKTKDQIGIHRFSKRLNVPNFAFHPINFLAIEGNIGAGKTSLARMIALEMQAKLITERYKDNPFLPKFYANQTRYAFPLEMSFLADRYQQWIDDVSQYDLFSDFMVSDYDVYKSLIFARITLQEEEKQLYKRLFHIMYNDLPKPDLYIYLYQSTDRLLQNIKARGRSYEQNISKNYLNDINTGYLDFIKGQHFFPAKIIDITDLDFIANREDYLYILRKITTYLETD